MKEKIAKNLLLSTIIIYVAGVILGVVIIWAIPYLSNISGMKNLAQALGNDYLTGWTAKHEFYGMDYFMYSEGKVSVVSKTRFSSQTQKELVESHLDELFEKGSIVVPVRMQIDNGENLSSCWGLLVGEVYYTDFGQPFASVLLRIFTELDTSIITYLIIFTLIFTVGAWYMFNYIKKSNELNMIRRDLVANVSHELKTPIANIHSMAEVLHDGIDKNPESQRQYTGMILSETDRLANLVSDILKLSKLQSHKVEYRKCVTYADGILSPVLDRYMMLCGDSGITLDITNLHLKEIPALRTDPEKIVQVLDILLSNAVKYTGRNGTITVTHETRNQNVVICVSDNGPGIEPNKLKYVFDRFYRTNESRNTPGNGLGLAIADETIRGLDEKIWVESTLGEGSSFFFTITLA